MGRLGIVLMATVVLVVACGGDDDGGATTSSTTVATTSSTVDSDLPTGMPALPETDDFSAFVTESENISDELPFETSADVEIAYTFLTLAGDRAAELAPPEVADDWTTSLAPFRDFADLLSELGWDFAAAMDSGDPRADTFDDGSADAASQRIDDYCEGGESEDGQDVEEGGESEDGQDVEEGGESEDGQHVEEGTDGPVSESTTTSPPVTETGEGQIPFLGGVDEAGLLDYTEAVDEIYLAGYELDRRVAQLSANCEWGIDGLRLTEVAQGIASRPQNLPDVLVQHAYVCPGSVTAAHIDLSTNERQFEPDLQGLRAFAAVTNPGVVGDEERWSRFTARLDENCVDRSALRDLLSAGGDPPSSLVGWHAYVCPEQVTSLFG